MTSDQALKFLEFISIYTHEENWRGDVFLVHRPAISTDLLTALRFLAKGIETHLAMPEQRVMRRRPDGGYDFVKYSEIKQNDVIVPQDHHSFEVVTHPERYRTASGDQIKFHLSKL